MQRQDANENHKSLTTLDHLKKTDIKLFESISREEKRQLKHLEMIASENYVSPSVLEAQGSCLTNKYAEGYPGKRYYGGCEFVDEVETIAIERACKLFGSQSANVQPHSGSQANMAVYFHCLKPGDKVLGMNLAHGGHLTHGSPVNFSGKLFNIVSYGVQKNTGRIDYNEVETIAKKEKPKMILAGASAYTREIDFKIFREIADMIGAKLFVDMAHIAGLVACGEHQSPVPFAHFVSSTTHKTLRGPRAGLILCQEEDLKGINSQIFPGIQGGPLMHVIAAKAVAFGEALQPKFKTYIQQVKRNAVLLGEELVSRGYNLVSGGTDNHLLLVDLNNKNITGKDAERALDFAGITVNKNAVPFDTKSPFITSGIRIGTPALTTRGFKENEIKCIANWIDQVISNSTNETKLESIRHSVFELSSKYELFSKEYLN